MVKTPSLLDLIGLVPARDLTRAAKAVGLTPEALKKRVESVESMLGFKLVNTAAKALKPGEAGRLVIDHASRIFSQARDLTRDLEELAGLQAPEIVFGTDMLAAELPLGVALGRMATVNSRLRVHAVVGDFEELARAVMSGKLEFAIADTTSAERHPTRLAIEPIAEHRVFFFARQGHPLTGGDALKLETVLVFPLVSSRIPQRIAVHVAKSMPHAKVDRDTGDLSPSLMLDSFAVAKAAVLAGDAIGLAPLTAIEPELRSGKLALVPFDAPWLHLSYGLFYARKRSLSRAAQLFVTQLRQVETILQMREQRAVARMNVNKRKSRKPPAKSRRAAPAGGRRKTPTKRSR
ncbi:MAG: LysR family transcriptional regulator [Pseudomonadota bacterium]|jgi:DNA-binding transcriptional LysR family regulator|nr:LysR family transcriptional regulator [Pseudomonadota bacterium]MDQ1346462.1 LysR family transcriptional regulator [Pseudomonadota bacterium]